MISEVINRVSDLLRKSMFPRGGQAVVFGRTEITCPGLVCYIRILGKFGLLVIIGRKDLGMYEIAQKKQEKKTQLPSLRFLPCLVLFLDHDLLYASWYFILSFVFKEAIDAYCIKLKARKWFLNRLMNHKLWKALRYCEGMIFYNNFVIFSFKICMKACLLQISGYRQLYLDVESVRKKPYDSDNLQHEKLLLKVGFVFYIWS